MVQTLVALVGVSQVGKSSSFRQIEELLARHAAVSEYRRIPSTGNRTDFVATFKWHGTLVGLSSEGDNAELMQSHLPPLFAQHCAVILTATRTRGATVNYVDALCRRHGYTKRSIAKQRAATAADYAAANRATAHVLLNQIEIALDSRAATS